MMAPTDHNTEADWWGKVMEPKTLALSVSLSVSLSASLLLSPLCLERVGHAVCGFDE